MKKTGLWLAIACLMSASACAQEVVRHPPATPGFPIAQAVEVPGNYTTIYLSGVVAGMSPGSSGAPDRKSFGGDTRGQALNALARIEAQLKGLGLGMKDVVKMQVFLVPDAEKGGVMDFGGFMDAYKQYFGTESQPNLPARSVFQVGALAHPALLVEVEVVAVRKTR